MLLNHKKPLDPEIKDINIKRGARYDQCRAEITFDVSDGNGGREDLKVEYPMQDDRHLMMLMEKHVDKDGVVSRESVPHNDAQELAGVIRTALDKDEKEE
jgi:hypothetical protein